MARKSRYQSSINNPASPSSLAKAGIYTRLSVSAKNGDSESIINQFQIATNYIDHSEDLEYVKTYSDDGYTGRNFNRPGFQEMMQDAKAGLINCIIVKDISRLGRNYLTIGRLLYEVFPEQNIRFISINDNYDSAKNHNEKELLIMLQSIIDQEVSMDISRRVSSAIDAKKKSGTFLPPSGSIPYGYLRDEKNCTYAIDEDTFLVVKRMSEINAELLRRKKEAVLARGEEWLDPAEAERIEEEKAAVIREENRIADLKAKCAKKGLDFDTENAKYLAKQAKKKK